MFSKQKYLELHVSHGTDAGRTRILREGLTVLGSSDAESDLTLRGLRIQPRHLEIETVAGETRLTNLAGGATLLQRADDPGSVVTAPVTLHPGDMLQIGEETLISVRRSTVAVEKAERAGAGFSLELGENWPLLALGGVVYLAGAVWWFGFRDTAPAPTPLYLTEERIAAYGATVAACAAAAPGTDAVAPLSLNLAQNPDAAWRVLTSTAATTESHEAAAATLSQAVMRDLAAAESLLRLGNRDEARAVYRRLDAMVPAPPLMRDAEAQLVRCDLKSFVQRRLARLRPPAPRR